MQQHRYKELFTARPDLLRSCIAHEIGHCVLRHDTWNRRPQNTEPLFPDFKPEPRYLHDSSLKPLAFSEQEINQWCKQAFKGDEAARQRLVRLKDRMEPDWMFWQAEHFSMCFLISRDRLLQHLNDGWEVSSWFAIRRFAERFGVSPSMMRVRLTKLGALTIEDGKPVLGPMLRNPGLLRSQ